MAVVLSRVTTCWLFGSIRRSLGTQHTKQFFLRFFLQQLMFTQLNWSENHMFTQCAHWRDSGTKLNFLGEPLAPLCEAPT